MLLEKNGEITPKRTKRWSQSENTPTCGCDWDFCIAQMVKNPPALQETWVQSLGWEDTLEKEMATHSSILARKSHGRRSLVGYSPQGRKESDTTE